MFSSSCGKLSDAASGLALRMLSPNSGPAHWKSCAGAEDSSISIQRGILPIDVRRRSIPLWRLQRSPLVDLIWGLVVLALVQMQMQWLWVLYFDEPGQDWSAMRSLDLH